MRLTQMKCQNCNQNLDIDLDHLTSFCPYCGTKLMFDMEKLNEVLVAKEQTKQKELEYEHEINMKKIESEEADKEEKKNNKNTIIIAIAFAVVILFSWLIGKWAMSM